MPSRARNYHRPTDLADAVRLLRTPDSLPLAGGTRLLAGSLDLSQHTLIDLQALGLDGIDLHEHTLHLGAMTRLSALLSSTEISGGRGFDLLHQAVYAAGPNTYRNAATLGGVIGWREPESELLALLLVMEARLLRVGEGVSPEISLSDYLTAGEKPGGLLTEIVTPWQDGRGALERVARTPADTPIVAVALWQPDKGTIRAAAVGIGARPMRLPEAESALNAGDIEAAIQAAHAATTHPGDFRGSAEYRAEMAGVLLKRAFEGMN